MTIIRAMYSPEPITVDGVLSEPVWRQTEAYELQMVPAKDNGQVAHPLTEAGRVRLAWDDESLHIAFEMVDSDVVQECDEDQAHHYKFGDVAEVFIKPADSPWYWELFATPNGRQTAFFYPSAGRKGLPSTLEYESNLRTGAHVDGTLNDWRDRDRGWSAQFAMPRAELAAAGIPLDENHDWTMLFGRYNYGRYLSAVELSSFPEATLQNFHHHPDYASLKLVRG